MVKDDPFEQMLVRHGVNDRDVRVDFYRLAIENGGPVTPLPHGFERRLEEHGIASDHLERLNRAVAGNPGMQFHTPFLVHLFRQSRINGVNAVNQHGGIEVRHPQDGWTCDVRLNRRRWYRRACIRDQSYLSPRNAWTPTLRRVIRLVA